MPLLKKKSLLLMVIFSGAGQLFASTSLSILPPEDLSNNFNALVREVRPSWWGNWSLDLAIKPGAIGVIDTNTGTFHSAGQQISNISVVSGVISEELKLSTSDVKGPQVASFSMNDQSSKVSVNTDLKWQFSKRGAMMAQWDLVQEQSLKGPFQVINENMDLLKSVAEDMEMYDPEAGAISQGFGVITGVLLAKSGMNVASLSDASQWSITGQADSLQSMLGRGSAKASYSSAGGDSDVMSVIWPSEPNTTTDDLVPVAYTFASINGEQIIPYWIEEIEAFQIIFENKGSYFVKATLKYQSSGGEKELHQDIVGFMTRSMENIPLDATELTLEMEFVDAIPSTTDFYHWDTPLGTWSTGKRHVEIDGWWPGQPSFIVQEDRTNTTSLSVTTDK
ncbi:hypothetical protein [Endozoicomonas atrinae]|uniref:hypothetical protein n=1 Tax=Endozoicomonas atrinae TaxID=1333660 RepID=UPI0008248BAE|nr:hypothetical protein [Endozoicomonas atrinae]